MIVFPLSLCVTSPPHCP